MKIKAKMSFKVGKNFRIAMTNIFQTKMRAVIAKELLKIGVEIRDSIASKAEKILSPSWQQSDYFTVGDSVLGGVAASKVEIQISDKVIGKGKFTKTFKNSVVAVNIVDFATLDAAASNTETGFAYWRLHFGVGEFKRTGRNVSSRTSTLGNQFVHGGSLPVLVFNESLQMRKRNIAKRVERRVRAHVRASNVVK